MRFDILTLFPEIFSGYLSQSLLAKAIDAEKVAVHLHNYRDWTSDKHKQVDDRPFGGGPGMLLKVGPVVECVEEVQEMSQEPAKLVMLSPRGRRLNQPFAEELAQSNRLMLLCGRYEGFDQRICDILKPVEVSIGEYILNGGEVAAMVIVDAIVRLLPGVLGDEQSAREDTFSQPARKIEHAQYTRPRDYRGHSVPDVLVQGDHKKVAKWQTDDSDKRTKEYNSHNKHGDFLQEPPAC